MSRVSIDKTNFTAGELAPELFGRGDLRAYANGAAKLRNVFIDPSGGLCRRAGLRFIDTARGPGRLIAFEFNTEQTYLLVFSNQRMDVYRDDVRVADIAVPWTEAQLSQINWTQSADTLLVVHPEVEPRQITRTAHDAWQITTWSFVEEDGVLRQPWHKFAAADVTLTPSAVTGSITLTASAAFFDATHAGQRMRLKAKQVQIDSITSSTQAVATVLEDLPDTQATTDWEEAAFSSLRGWPAAVCFHQDRLVIGGSRDLPNRLWLSKTADLYNFDLGTGLDDEAIEFAILSDQVNAIRSVFSGRHLQLFTSGAEWMVTGEPLTPANMQLQRQTRIGSPVDRTVPPRDVDGATLFVPRNGRELREFLFADVEQAYQATDLALLARHLITAPTDQDYDQHRRLFFVATGDGRLATLTVFRAEQVTAWTTQQTNGMFRAVTVLDENVYVLVERNGATLIERFDDTVSMDAALVGTSGTPTTSWSGLDYLEGRSVKVLADGALRADAVVSSGTITLDEPASTVQAGLGFSHEVAPLPPAMANARGSARAAAVRLIEAIFRVGDTSFLKADTGSGLKPLPFKRMGNEGVLDTAPQPFTGDKRVRALGWKRGGIDPLWRIAGDEPLPLRLLSVTTEVKVND